MEITLPLGESYVDALQYHAFFSSIVLTNKNNYKYVLSKYINLTVRSIFRPHIDFCFQGVLDSSPSPINKFQIRGKVINIIKFINLALQNENYVYVKVNEFYLPHKMSYKKEMFVHDILVYGIDTVNKFLYTYGFDDTRRLNYTVYTFDEFEKSYYSLTYEWDYDLFLISEKQGVPFQNFDQIILKEFRKYSLSENPYSETINKVVSKEGNEYYTPINISSFDIYGIACYDFIISLLNEYIQNNAFFDPRSLYVLRNQKKVIRDSLKLMNCNDIEIPQKYENIYKKTEICTMLYFKYEITQDKKVLFNLLSHLKQIKEEEILFFKNFLENWF